MTAPLETMSKDWAPGRLADYRPEHWRFQREQSRTMRSLEWEDAAETQPMTVWSRIVQFNIGFWLLMAPFLYVGRPWE